MKKLSINKVNEQKLRTVITFLIVLLYCLMLHSRPANGNVNISILGEGGENDKATSHPFVSHWYFPGNTASKFVMFKATSTGDYFAVGYGVTTVNDITIVKYNNQGDTVWSIRHLAPNGTNRYAFSGDVASDGSLFILTNNAVPQIQWNEVMHFNANGDSLWSTPVSAKVQWSGLPFNSIRCTPDGGCVIAGGSNGFPSTASVLKIGSSGNVEWTSNTFEGDYGYNWFYALDVNQSGEIFATGRVHNNTNGRESFITVKIDNKGNKLWEKIYYSGLATSGDSIIGSGHSILATSDLGCIVGGYAKKAGFSGRAVMKRLDESGKIIWDKSYQRWTEDVASQNAKVYNIVSHTSGNFLALIHQYDGSSAAVPTLMTFNALGDTIWTQYGIDRRWRITGTDSDNNILLCGDLPHPQAGWYEHFVAARATSGGILYSPICTKPYDNSIENHRITTLSWMSEQHKGSFKLQVSTDSTFNTINFEQTSLKEKSWVTPELKSLTKYFWRVQIFGPEGGPSKWSNIFRFTVKDLTGIGTQSLVKSMSIYPNPASKNATLCLELQKQGNITIELFNLQGQIIYKDELHGLLPGKYEKAINLNGINSGIYICRLNSGNENYNTLLLIR